MPSRHSLRLFIRGVSLCASVVLPMGVLTLAHSGGAAPVTVATRSHAAAPTTTAAPPVTVPPTIPPTTAAPAPVRVTTPTTARPRVTTAPRPAPRAIAQAASVPNGTPEQRGAQALALINYPWQTLGYTVSFEPGRETYLGLTDSGTRVIHIYVRDSESLDTLARTIGHEMGHALDFSLTTDAERAQYIAIRGINATVDTWFGCDACEDYSTAAGDWAETFQYYLFGPGQYFSKMGPPPSADQLAQLAAIFAPQ